MFKVLIVDDEYYVMSLIKDIVDWNSLNMRVVGTANNGHAALDMIKNLKPDIMIVDVRMPGYDGITLMQKAREISNSIKFIVISGHRRFDYAKSAIKYNVEDYLLKPISKEELEAILQRLRLQLEEEQTKQQEINLINNKLGLSKTRMHSILMTELLNGVCEWSDMTVQSFNEAYLTTFSNGVYRCIIVKLDNNGQDMDKFFRKDILHMLESVYSEHLSQQCTECIAFPKEMRIYFFLQYQEKDDSLFQNAIKTAYKQASEKLEKFEELCQTIGIGNTVESLSAAFRSLQSAEKAIDSRFDLGNGKILTPSQVRDDPGILYVVVSDQRIDMLMKAFKSLEIKNIRDAIEKLYDIAGQYQSSSALTITLCREIHKIFCEYMKHIDLLKENCDELSQELFSEIEKCQTKKNVCDALILHISKFIDKNIKNKNDATNPSIRIAIRYIQDNFHKNLSLSTISTVVNLTPVYFSILFKRETGMTFIDYLNKFRIESAKKLLKDNRYNINEIADQCGYQEARYFSKIFKKHVGITPSDYRSRQIG